jgi:hypothetical protein
MTVSRLVILLTSAFVLVAASPSLAHATAQEAFICSFQQGKTVDDLMQVAGEFKAAVQDIAGGKKYSFQVLTPIVAQNLDSVIWIGSMPSFAEMAAFNDAYNGSKAAMTLGPKFQAVADCESRSMWNVHTSD